MKKMSRKIIASFLMLVMMMAVVVPTMVFATEGEEANDEIYIKEVNCEIELEDKLQLELCIPEAMEEEKELVIKWTSSDEKVATVDEDGLVTAVTEGQVTITAEIMEEEKVLDKEEIVIKVGKESAGDKEPPKSPDENNDDPADDDEGENLLTDISQVKLNTKIKFTGVLYKSNMFSFSSNDILNLVNKNQNVESEDETKSYTAGNEYTDRVALVTDILLKKNEGMIGVAFIEEGKKLPTMGYIKFTECKVEEVGKYIQIGKLEAQGTGVSCKITINGEEYPVTSDTTVGLSANGIQIGEKVVLLQDGAEINIVDVTGGFSLDLAGKSATAGGSVSVLDKITIDGNATLRLISNGVEVSGDANVNGKDLGSGAAQVTFDKENIVNVEVTDASVLSMNLTPFANQLVQSLIKAIKSIITAIFSKLLTMAV